MRVFSTCLDLVDRSSCCPLLTAHHLTSPTCRRRVGRRPLPPDWRLPPECSTSAERHRSPGWGRAAARRRCWREIRWPFQTALGRCPLSARHPPASWHQDWTDAPRDGVSGDWFRHVSGTLICQILTTDVHGGQWMANFEQWILHKVTTWWLSCGKLLFIVNF